MSRRSIRRAFRKFGRKIKRAVQKAAHFIMKHKKMILMLGIGIALAATPLGTALRGLMSSLGKSIVSNPMTVAKVVGGTALAYGTFKGGQKMGSMVSSHKTLLLSSLGLITGYVIYKKIK